MSSYVFEEREIVGDGLDFTNGDHILPVCRVREVSVGDGGGGNL